VVSHRVIYQPNFLIKATMENQITTHTDYEWSNRINSLVNRIVYNQPIPDDTNRYELEAARLVIRWESRVFAKDEQKTKPTVNFKAVRPLTSK